MAKHRSFTDRATFVGALALLAAGVAGHSIAPTSTMASASAVFPRQAPTTDAPDASKPDLRAELAPKLQAMFDGDTYDLPDTDLAVLQTDGSSVTLQPSGIVVNGQSTTVPAATSAITINVGGLDVTVAPAQPISPSRSVLDTFKDLGGLANQIQQQIQELKPRLDSFSDGDTQIGDLQGQYARDIDTLVDAMDQFDGRLEGLAAAAQEPRDAADIELGSFDPQSSRNIVDAFRAAKPARTLIVNYRKLIEVGSALPPAVIDAAKLYWKTAAVSVAGAAVAINTFSGIDWDAAVATSTSTSADATTSTSSSSETATLYWLSSKPGTDKATFDTYCKSLDGGAGYLDSRDGNPKQGYQAELKDSQVADVKSQPWFDFIEPVQELGVDDDEENYRYLDWERMQAGDANTSDYEASEIRKRMIVSLPGAAPQLKLISAQPGRGPIDQQDYFSDDSAGSGVTIYVIDDGFNLNSLELQPSQRKVNNYIVPNRLTLSPKQNSKNDPMQVGQDENIDGPGHGTGVAIAAAGTNYGPAHRADLFVIKAKGTVKNTLSTTPDKLSSARYQLGAVQDALSRIQDHITSNGLKGRAVVNMSWGIKKQLDQGVDQNSGLYKLFQEFEQWCQDNDVVWVIAAGNKPNNDAPDVLGEGVPQRLGTNDNSIITVGGVNSNGWLWLQSIPNGAVDPPMPGEGPGANPGSISIYAQAENVLLNLAQQGDTEENLQTLQGTSYAAPQVAGLAAYFLIKPPGGRPFGGGHTAMDMKRAIWDTAVHWPDAGQQDLIKSANNGARSDDQYLCRRAPPGSNPVDGCPAPPPPPPGPAPGVLCDPDTKANPPPVSYQRNAFEAAARHFCDPGYAWLANPNDPNTSQDNFWMDTTHIDPLTNLPAVCIAGNIGPPELQNPDSGHLCDYSGPGSDIEKSNSRVHVQVFPSPSQDGCSALNKYKLPNGDACVRNFMNVLDTCMVSGGPDGKAGVWKETTPDVGCWDWWIWGQLQHS